MISGNTITGNYGPDIKVVNDIGTIPNISFNIYDTIEGDTGVGQFIVNSNGDLARLSQLGHYFNLNSLKINNLH